MKVNYLNIIFIVFFLPFFYFGQTKIDIKKLDKLFWDNNFSEVISGYQQLYNQDRNNIDVNFKLGTCLLHLADSTFKIEKSIGHLTFACSKPQALAEYHYFLGKALHLIGDFRNAVIQLENYKSKKTKSTIDYAADQLINFCNQAEKITKKAESNFQKIATTSPESFGRAYTMERIGLAGQFYISLDLQTKIDKKNNFTPLLYRSENSSLRVFASYGEKDNGNKDLYLLSGSFDSKKIEKLTDVINTSFDEDFPIFDEQNGYLYFSSKGHGSGGGFDLFRSKYDTVDHVFLQPENLGIGISTPYDDFLFLYNPINNLALITRNQLSIEGEYSIFTGKINFFDEMLIKKQQIIAQFKNEINSTIKLFEIEVRDSTNKEVIGNYLSNDQGQVTMELNPAKYNYTIRLIGSSDNFQAVLTIPESANPIKQDINYSIDAKNSEIVKINEITNGKIKSEIIAQNIPKEANNSVKLTSSDEPEKLDKNQEKQALSVLGMEDFSPTEVIDAVTDKIIEIELAQKENQQLMDNLNVVIVNNRNYHDELQTEIDSIQGILKDLTKIERIEKLTYIKNLIEEQTEVKKQTLWMQQLNDSLYGLNSESNPNLRNFKEIQRLDKEIESLIQQNKQEEAYSKVLDKSEEIQTLSTNSVFEVVYNNLLENELEETRIEKKIITLSNELITIKEEIKKIESSLINSSKKEKSELETKKVQLEQKIESNLKQSKRLNQDLEELKNIIEEMELRRNILASVNKQNLDETISYEQAKKKYFSDQDTSNSTLTEFEEKLNDESQSLTQEEKRFIEIQQTYNLTKNNLSENEIIKTEELIELEKDYSIQIDQLLTEIKANSTGKNSLSTENFLEEKLQESQSKLSSLQESTSETNMASTEKENDSKQQENSLITLNKSSQNKDENQQETSISTQSNSIEKKSTSSDNVTQNQYINQDENQQETSISTQLNSTEKKSTSSENVTQNQSENQEENQQETSNNTQSDSTEKKSTSSENVTQNQSENQDENQQETSNNTQSDSAEKKSTSSENVTKYQRENQNENQQETSNSIQSNSAEKKSTSSENVTQNQSINQDENQQETSSNAPLNSSENKSTSSENVTQNQGENNAPIGKLLNSENNEGVKELPNTNESISNITNEVIEDQRNEISKNISLTLSDLQKTYPTVQFISFEQLTYENEKNQQKADQTAQHVTQLKSELEKEKNKKRKTELTTKITEKEEELSLISEEINKLKEQISKTKTEEIILTYENETKIIDSNQIKEIASSPSYQVYVEQIVEFEKESRNYKAIKNKLSAKQKFLTELISDQVYSTNQNKNSEEITLLIKELEQLESTKQTSLTKLKSIQENVETIENQNREIESQLHYLVKNRIEPLKIITKVEILQNIPETGFEINVNATSQKNTIQSLPLNVKQPSGLVYRVQVGAFRKPLKTNVFYQFTPVSGELQANGLTVYLAGYFNNSTKAIDARKQIQQLGYSDAFIVAYCNGKKLSLGEARQLEARGECIPLDENLFIVEVQKNMEEALKEQETLSNQTNKNSALAGNNVDIQSLYFTVQIGVYNKPIIESQKFPKLSEISSNLSPSKQIRYSSGKFKDINEAQERKKLAVSTGITDAFVVAYYKGERITISAANELIAKNGNSIFNQENSNVIQNSGSATYIKNEKTYFETVKKEPEIKKYRYQVNEEFDEFPKDKLSYFNNFGLFQYNPTTKKIESIEFSDKNDLDNSLKFSGYISRKEIENSENMELKVDLQKLPGDFADFILRTNGMNSIFKNGEISVILNSDFVLNENYTKVLKETFELNSNTNDKR